MEYVLSYKPLEITWAIVFFAEGAEVLNTDFEY